MTGAGVTGTDRAASAAPITVVHLITTLSQGGAERVLSQTVPRPADIPRDAAGRPRERHVVVSLVDGGIFADELTDAGVEVRGLGMRPGRDVVRGALRLSALLRELQPTLIIGWMYHACFLALLARPLAGAARHARMVWNLRGSLHTSDGLPRSTRALIRLLARTARRPEAVAINSRTGQQHHVAVGYRPRRWVLLPNGCDTARFRPDPVDRDAIRAELGIPDDAVVAMTVARVHPQKDHATLVAAMHAAHAMHAAPPSLELVLVGTGTEPLTLRDPGGLRIHGLGERRDVERLLRAADLVVSSSITEGLPNALLEAMASGVVPVATDVGDCRRVIGDAGVIVPVRDIDGLADAIAGIVAMDPADRRALGGRARERIERRYGLAAARAEYRALWDADTAGRIAADPRNPGPLHVVHIIARMNVGGPARIIAGLLAELDPSHVRQTLITGEVGQGEEDWSAVRDHWLATDPRVIRLSGLGRAIAPLRDLRTRRTLTGLLRGLGPDVVITHTAKAGQLGRTAALRAGVPHVVHTFHGHTLHGYFPRPVTALFTHLERRLARRTDDLLAVGARVRDDLLAAGIGTPEQYTVLPPGVADDGVGDRSAARRALALPDDVAVIAFVGRLSGVKRPDRFLAAAELIAAERPATVFLVVGDGDERTRLESLPRRAAVRVRGWRGAVGTIHAAVDLVVVTSDNEGMPVTLIEAAMAGRACVTTDVGSAGEVVLDGRTGRVVARDADAIAAAVTALLDDDAERERAGAAAREHARAHFGPEALTDRLLHVIRRGPRLSRR